MNTNIFLNVNRILNIFYIKTHPLFKFLSIELFTIRQIEELFFKIIIKLVKLDFI